MKTYAVTEYEQEDYERTKDMGIDEVISRLAAIERNRLPDYSYDHKGTEDDYGNFADHMAMQKARRLLEGYRQTGGEGEAQWAL